MSVTGHLSNLFWRIARRPTFWVRARPLGLHNKFFDQADLCSLFGHTQRMVKFDEALAYRVTERRIKGQRAWEYGLLLDILSRETGVSEWKALDVGPGASIFPTYLRSQLAALTTIDYPSPLEPLPKDVQEKYAQVGIHRIEGTMLELPFPSRSFDLVTCISTIEHLDDRGEGVQVPYDEYLRLTRIGLKEMMRVVRQGGLFYLTTEAYVPGFQTTDAWSFKRRGGVIWSVYRAADIAPVFTDTLAAEGFEPIGRVDLDPELLTKNARHANWRGRYFSTFCLAYRRVKL